MLRMTPPSTLRRRLARALAIAVIAVSWMVPTRAGADPLARRAQAELLVTYIHEAVRHERRVGSTVEFTLWTDGGAITAVSLRWLARGDTPGDPVARSELARALDIDSVVTFVGTRAAYRRVQLQREPQTWRIGEWADVSPPDHPRHPPEGRSIPTRIRTIEPARRARLEAIAAEVARNLRVPFQGTAEFRITVDLDDHRVTGWTPQNARTLTRDSTHTRRKLAVDDLSSRALVGALLPFSHGLGPRTVEITLRGAHRAGTATAYWDIVQARVMRSSGPVDEFADIVRDYRRTHEAILLDWQRSVHDSAVQMAGFTAEQVAVWVVGGWLFKAAGKVMREAAPRVVAILREVGKKQQRRATELFETLLTRLPGKDRRAIETIMAKSETEGLSALTRAERTRLTAHMKRLDGMVDAPLTPKEKVRLRRAMRRRFKKAHPEVHQTFEQAGMTPEIHHRLPLEWSHLLPSRDINSTANLKAVHVDIHREINAIWTRFRTAPADRVTDVHVEQVARIVDRHFERWYNRLPTASNWLSSVVTAKHQALREVDAVVTVLRYGAR